jgi:hypothetical protein
MRALKRSRYASGGKITGVPIPGEAVIKEAEADSDGFKKGGMIATGKKLARGGFAKPVRKFASGGSPMSAAAKGGKDAPDKGSECG